MDGKPDGQRDEEEDELIKVICYIGTALRQTKHQ